MKVKICGLRSVEDAKAAIDAGADALGFVMEPTSPRRVHFDQIQKMLDQLSTEVPKVAVFGPSQTDSPPRGFDLIQATSWPNDVGTSFQIHTIRLMPDDNAETVKLRLRPGSLLLLDSFQKDGYGGHGVKVDWNLAREVVSSLNEPVVLAGGLTPDNVQEAIDFVRPAWVDVSSGIESERGVKDHAKIAAFVKAAKRA